VVIVSALGAMVWLAALITWAVIYQVWLGDVANCNTSAIDRVFASTWSAKLILMLNIE
jgi:hypothetical protein